MEHDEIELIVLANQFEAKVKSKKTGPVLAKNLMQLPTVWAAVRDVLGFSAMDAIGFVERQIFEMQPPLYLTDDEHEDALPRAYLLGWELGPYGAINGQRLIKAGEDNFANWWGNDKPKYEYTDDPDDGAALHLYLSPPDANAIVDAARAITTAKPLSLHPKAEDADTLQSCPDELRAAIEAFRAVHDDPAALKGRHPKQALLAWLEANKPGIGPNARERIATVANWQPKGGAPKTPNE